jgi:hypothetical protein
VSYNIPLVYGMTSNHYRTLKDTTIT